MRTKILIYLFLLLNPALGFSEIKFDTLDCGPKTGRALLQMQKSIQQQKAKNDSLLKNIEQLKGRTDSLQKITEKTEIGKEYFHDILTSQTTIFVTIIGLIALVSWGWIMIYLRRRINRQTKSFNAKVVEQNNEFKKTLKETKKEIEDTNNEVEYHKIRTDVNISRAMFNICVNNNEWFSSFLWCIRLMEELCNLKNHKNAFEGNDYNYLLGESIGNANVCINNCLSDPTPKEYKIYYDEMNKAFESILSKEKEKKFSEDIITAQNSYYSLCFNESKNIKK